MSHMTVTQRRGEVVEVGKEWGGGRVGKDSVVSRTVTAHFDWRVHGCCTICQTDRSQISGNTADEMKRHFPIKPGQPIYRNDSYQFLVLYRIP